jgi:hypothetical protein
MSTSLRLFFSQCPVRKNVWAFCSQCLAGKKFKKKKNRTPREKFSAKKIALHEMFLGNNAQN